MYFCLFKYELKTYQYLKVIIYTHRRKEKKYPACLIQELHLVIKVVEFILLINLENLKIIIYALGLIKN